MNHFSRLSGSPRIQPGIRLRLSGEAEEVHQPAAAASSGRRSTPLAPPRAGAGRHAARKLARSPRRARSSSCVLAGDRQEAHRPPFSCHDPSATHSPSSHRTSSVISICSGIGDASPGDTHPHLGVLGHTDPQPPEAGQRDPVGLAHPDDLGPGAVAPVRPRHFASPTRAARTGQSASPRPARRGPAPRRSDPKVCSCQRQTSIMLTQRRSRSGRPIRRAMATRSPTSRSSAGFASGSPSSPSTNTEWCPVTRTDRP